MLSAMLRYRNGWGGDKMIKMNEHNQRVLQKMFRDFIYIKTHLFLSCPVCIAPLINLPRVLIALVCYSVCSVFALLISHLLKVSLFFRTFFVRFLYMNPFRFRMVRFYFKYFLLLCMYLHGLASIDSIFNGF